MRGDSLRDFYAKTLAVLGLGLLAGAGAAVDYWPVGSAVPVVDAVGLPTPHVPVLAQNLNQSIPAPVLQRAVYVRGTIHAKNVGTARFLTPVPVAATPSATEPSFAPLPDLSVPIDDQQSTLAMGPSMTMARMDYVVEVPPPTAAPSSGFIGGALRKTKDSIGRAGAVTGATIADAVKGVFGAFKKVNPF